MFTVPIRCVFFFFMCVCWHTFSVAAIDVQQQVETDVMLLQSLQQTTQQIQNHGPDDFVTVGGDMGCDFNAGAQRLQDAIDSGAAEVRVADNHIYQENLILGDFSIIVRGGFADCAEAENNNQVLNAFTEIDGSAVASPVVSMANVANPQLVRFENLVFSGGSNGAGAFGAGISLQLANVELQLVRVAIIDNNAQFGGGIGIDAGSGISNVPTTVIGEDVFIGNNAANAAGGGIYCGFAENMVFFGVSAIFGNTARVGGGVYTRNGCDVSMYPQRTPGQFVIVSGIIDNQATEEAGGVYQLLGGSVFLFGQRMCANGVCLGDGDIPLFVWMNQADSDASGREDGGGIYIADSNFVTEFYANGTVFEDNTAGGNGGAAFVSRNGVFEVNRTATLCWNADRCNYFLANTSGQTIGLGGAIYNDGAQVNISNAYFEENRADFGTAIYSSGVDASTRIEGGVLSDNGNNGQDGFSDQFVLSAGLGAELTIIHTTLADNDAENAVINIDPPLNSSLNLQSSIVHDPSSGSVLSGVSSNTNIRCLMAHEDASFSGDLTAQADPLFIDRAAGDFRLDAQNSPAVDFCDDSSADIQQLDIDLEARGWNDPSRPDNVGAFDLGANETYDNDIIFIDGVDG